jgi:alpha-1,2-mannosyltransferase
MSGPLKTDKRAVPWWLIGGAVVATSVVLAAIALFVFRHNDYWNARWMVDLTVYLASGDTIRGGGSLYDMVVVSPLYGPMPYVYPPFTALLFFVPLSLFTASAASFVWNTASLVALGAAVWLTLGIAGVRDRRVKFGLAILFLVLATWLLPMRVLLVAGQINTFLLVLVLLDFRKPSHRFQGIGVGIAAGLKVTPLIFIAYLLITRRFAAARNAAIAFAATVAAGFAVMPGASLTYWGGLVFHSSRVADPFDTPNQSLSGMMARIFHSGHFQNWWFLVLAVVAVFGLTVGAYAYRRRADFLGMTATAITGLLISPVSWEHHWVYVIPLLIWLAVWAYRERSVPVALGTGLLVAVFTIRTFSLVGIQESPPAPMDLAAWQQLVASAFPAAGLALLIFGPFWLRRHFPAKASAVPEIPAQRRAEDRVPAAVE